jgi:preprotein translocase subunit SecD
VNRNLLWRGLAVLVVVVGCILLAYPPQEKINLGLDLRGGVHLVLDVQAEEALRAETDKDMDTFVRQLGEEGTRTAGSRRPAFPPKSVTPSRR